MTQPDTSYNVADMDRATTGREVGQLVALVLMRVVGDPEAALEMLALFETWEDLKPQEAGELDAIPIAAQAIREARALVGR